MRIKEDSISRLLDSINIVDVVSEYVRLKKTGKNFVALCPFHQEKTPSFTVNPAKNLFYCFGCGEGGNTVSFLMKIEKLPFVEAIESLSKKFNIPLEYEKGEFVEKDLELEKLYEYSQIANRYFFDNLTKTDEGRKALKYLYERGISEETIKTFNLGYALSAWNGLVTFTEKNKLDIEIFEHLGLVSKKDDRYWDRFRGRIIFPVYSTIGKVIAFGGRILIEEENQPKYINSPETRIYTKGRTLFGLYHSKDFIRNEDHAILVEGYLDFLSLYQNGIKNVIATAGTALTIDQLNLLSRYTKNVSLVFDGDQAGIKAAIRSIKLFLQTDLDFKIITLSEEEDPDSYIRKYGPTKFRETLLDAKNYIDFVYELSQTRQALKDASSKAKVINSLLENTARVKDPIRREIFIKEIATKFKVSEKSLLQSLSKYLDEYKRMEETTQHYDKSLAEIEQKRKEINEVLPVEKGILKILFENNKKVNDLIFLYLNAKDFFNEKAGQIFSIIQAEYEEHGEINITTIMNKVEDETLMTILFDSIFEKYSISKEWQDEYSKKEDYSLIQIAHDLIRKFKELYIKNEIAKTQEKIKNTQDFDEKLIYIEIDNQLKKELKKLLSPDYFE